MFSILSSSFFLLRVGSNIACSGGVFFGRANVFARESAMLSVLLVCSRMLPVCYSYVPVYIRVLLVCYPYLPLLYFNQDRFTDNSDFVC